MPCFRVAGGERAEYLVVAKLGSLNFGAWKRYSDFALLAHFLEDLSTLYIKCKE